MKNIPSFYLLLPLAFLVATNNPVYGKEEASSRMINAKGKQYILPNFVEIRLSNKTIYKDKKVRPWDKSDKTDHFEHGKYIFLTSHFNDGIDIDATRLFIIKGEQVKENDIIVGNSTDKFIRTKKGGLYYWNEWFCNQSNKKVKSKGSYIFEFSPESGEFQEKSLHVPNLKDCRIPFVENTLNKQI